MSGQADLFESPNANADVFAKPTHQPANQLQAHDWPASLAGLSSGWLEILEDFWKSSEGDRLDRQMRARLAEGRVIYPRTPYRALALTPFHKVRVLILGQDPYHGPGQADGLAFSVGPGQKVPPSLRNIFKEIQRDAGALAPVGRLAGSLERWAEQGVLLLNTSLTVEDGSPASHSDWGWGALTDRLISALAHRADPCAFLLWGAHAQTKAQLIERPVGQTQTHLVLKSNHPSPLSASRPPVPFLGCGHFGQVNRWLAASKQKPIDW